jgi:predicted 3-demethylubiquinone-9 3-methyltransferase (glyoxalase superfamily)
MEQLNLSCTPHHAYFTGNQPGSRKPHIRTKIRDALVAHQSETIMTAKVQPCLWFNKNAEEAARFYAATFANSRIDAIHRAPGDYPSGKKGDVLTVEMSILGMQYLLLNGGPQFTFDEAISFQILTDDQEETDRYWNAIVSGGGQESACGWCKDRFGLSWQITPRRLMQLMAAGGETATRAFGAMMEMRKIDIAALDRAVGGAAK